jgi:hypothetical protein
VGVRASRSASWKIVIPLLVAFAGLLLPAVASSQASLTYEVTSVHETATWHFATGHGTGTAAVSFTGTLRRELVAGHLVQALRGRALYSARNSRGCSFSQIALVDSNGIGFVASPSRAGEVRVTWALPVPRTSRCDLLPVARLSRRLQQAGMLSRELPASRFSCPYMALSLDGRDRLPWGASLGAFTFRAAMVLKRV